MSSPKRLLLLSASSKGGAGLAAKRWANFLAKESNFNVDFWTRETVASPLNVVLWVISKSIERTIEYLFNIQIFIASGVSLNQSQLADINSNFDLIFIHWINSSFISPSTLSAIKIPIVFYCHDEWLCNGLFGYEKLFRDKINCGFLNSFISSKQKKFIRYIAQLENKK